jgi:predicted dehydrogenase
MKKHESNGMNRRQFISSTALGVTMFSILPAKMVSGADRVAANDRINIAGIGVGPQGTGDIDAMAGERQNIVALCDVDDNYAAKTFQKYSSAKKFKDYRVMLDQMDKEIDAVVIGTPDHTHAVIAMEAMRRGKHVYCEKPLAHNVHEVRQLMAAARKYKVTTQLGNQGHSSGSIRRVCEWVGAGAIGKVHTVHARCDAFRNVYSQMRNLAKADEKHEVPAHLDYDLWIGPAQFRPYTPLWVHWNWRGWMPFGTGTIGDWFCHVIDPTFWALNLDAPTSIKAEVTEAYDPAKHGLTYPPATRITFQFPARGERGPITLVWHDGGWNMPRPEKFSADDRVPGTGAVLMGDKGMIVHGSHGAGSCYITPDTIMEQYSGANAPAETIVRVKNHAWDWVEAIRTGRLAGSNFDYGGPLTQAALLGAIAIRFAGQTLEWDDKATRFTNNEAANAFVKPAYREGWQLPV